MARRLGAVILAAALVTAQTAFAGDAAPAPPVSPLAPGPAAGLHGAQNGPDINKVVVVAGIGLAALGIYLVVGTHYKVPPQNSSSSGTN